MKSSQRKTSNVVAVAGACRSAAVALSIIGALLVMLGGWAGAQAQTVPACFVHAQGFVTVPKVEPGGLTVTLPDGTSADPNDDIERLDFSAAWREGTYQPSDVRLTIRDGATGVAGPQCRTATRLDPTAPQATLAWLPGATMESTGARGPARVSWQPVSHNGVAASHYEIYQSSLRSSDSSARPTIRLETDAVVVDGSTTSVDIDLGVREEFYYNRRFTSPDNALIRAWWPDGVSRTVLLDAPQQIWSSSVESGAPVVTDMRWITGSSDSGGDVVLEWATSFDAQGRPADGYQLIDVRVGSYANTFGMQNEFAAGTTMGAVRLNRATTRVLRAYWNDGGPNGGPIKADASVGDFFPSSGVGGLFLRSRLPTGAEVAARTAGCTYGDYRVTDVATGELVASFDAPRDGSCYTSHGITLGEDTAALTPSRSYLLTFVSVDPATGGVVASYTRNFTTPVAGGHSWFSVSYTAEEGVLLDRATASLGLSIPELQRLSTVLFAYLAAVEDKPAVQLDAPNTNSGPRSHWMYVQAGEMSSLDNLADHFGGLNRRETVKISTLVLAYVVLTS